MAVAPEALEAAEAAGSGEAAPWRAISRGSGRVPGAARTAVRSVSSPSATAQTITKLLWAVAMGLIALQVAAEATGQRWSFSLPGSGQKPSKQAYVPLYPGQPAAAMPGVFGSPSSPASAPSGTLSTPGTLVAP